MPWKEFERRTTRSSVMSAGISRSKKLTLSKAAVDAIGVEHVELLYNEEDDKMALRPSKPDSPNAYKIMKGSNQVTLVAFISYHDLERAVNKRYMVKEEDGLFVIELSKPITRSITDEKAERLL